MDPANVTTRSARVIACVAALALCLLVAGLGAPRLDGAAQGPDGVSTWHRDSVLQQATADSAALERRLPVDGGLALVLVMFAAVMWMAPESGRGDRARSRWLVTVGWTPLSRVRAPPAFAR